MPLIRDENAPKPSRAVMEKSFEIAEASLWLEGMKPGPRYYELKARVLAGEITTDQAIEILKAQDAQNAGYRLLKLGGAAPEIEDIPRRKIDHDTEAYKPKMNHEDFGAWAGRCEDGLAYQERMRSEEETDVEDIKLAPAIAAPVDQSASARSIREKRTTRIAPDVYEAVEIELRRQKRAHQRVSSTLSDLLDELLRHWLQTHGDPLNRAKE